MRKPFTPSVVPDGGLFISCSSHEERCLALVRRWGDWKPNHALLFHYDDENPRREVNHRELRAQCAARCPITELMFHEKDAVASFRENGNAIKDLLTQFSGTRVIFDMTVFTKRHLLMMLNWLDDFRCWAKLFIVYSEPEDYEVSTYLPLSFGISGFEQIPGFAGTPDSSRPLHLLIILGYEGERALATYEQVQPIKTTLVIPNPPFRPEWAGRTEGFNKNLITRLGGQSVLEADAVDPNSIREVLRQVFGIESNRSDHAKVVCPLGTKPQALGVYLYTKDAVDPPAIIYAGPLRHNHGFYSHGIGRTWMLVEPQ